MSALLQLQSVQLSRGARRILDDITLDFLPGSVTALVGPNGAGKSTLLAVAAGDLEAEQGKVLLRGQALAEWKAKPLARERAVMPQEHAVRFAFRVHEVVAMGRLPHPPDPVKDAACIADALARADLHALIEREVEHLSGGEAARTTFARVLTQDTPLLLLDEPTAALDLRVIVVLHDLNLAAAYADRIVLLEQGRVAADGTPTEVLTREHIERVYQQPVLVLRHPQRDVPLVVVTDP